MIAVFREASVEASLFYSVGQVLLMLKTGGAFALDFSIRFADLYYGKEW